MTLPNPKTPKRQSKKRKAKSCPPAPAGPRHNPSTPYNKPTAMDIIANNTLKAHMAAIKTAEDAVPPLDTTQLIKDRDAFLNRDYKFNDVPDL